MYRQITVQWPSGAPFQQIIAKQLPPPQDVYNALTGEQGTQVLQGFLGIASGFFGGLTKFAIVLVLSIYWSIDRQHFERLWISLLPADRRRRAREVWRDLEDGVGGYIRSELLQSVLAGLLLGIGYYAMGLSFPALIALVGALLWLIPWLGAILALVLPLLAGLSAGTGLAIAAPVYTIIVLAFLELVVEPRLFNRRRYSSLLVIIMVVVMADAYGLIGLLLAPPLAAAIQTLFISLIQPSPSLTHQDLSFKVDTLRQSVAGMQAQVARRQSKPSPEVVNLMERLTNLMEQADQLFEAEAKPDTR
jgi:predicted PurR-regulated permease PerM